MLFHTVIVFEYSNDGLGRRDVSDNNLLTINQTKVCRGDAVIGSINTVILGNLNQSGPSYAASKQIKHIRKYKHT